MNRISRIGKTLFSKYLIVTNTVTTSTLLGVGDAITQNIEKLDNKDQKFNYHRTGRMMSLGLLFGPTAHVWYKVLDKFFPGTNVRIVAKKILSDQIVAGPFFCSAFFFGMSLLEGKTVQDGVNEVKSKFLTVYLIDWCVWPPAQFINFYFLPPRFRVAYVSLMTLLWNTFLSWMKHREHEHET